MACYCMRDGIPVHCPHFVPCGPLSSTGFVQCCGINHACGADLFCYSKFSQVGESGYYAGGCNDITYNDPSCSARCANQTSTEAVYSRSTSLWSCCFDNTSGMNCSFPTNITFEAPDPEALFAEPFSIVTATLAQSTISPVSSSTSSTTIGLSRIETSTITTSIEPSGTTSINTLATDPAITSTTISETASTLSLVTSPATSSATALADTSSDLSTGAKAGIGVATALLVVFGLGVLVFFYRRSRRRNRQQPEQLPMQYSSIWKLSREKATPQIYTVNTLERPAEMFNSSRRHVELPNNNSVHHKHTTTGFT